MLVVDSDVGCTEGGRGGVTPPQRKARAVEELTSHLETMVSHSSTLLSVPLQSRLNSLSASERNPNLQKNVSTYVL